MSRSIIIDTDPGQDDAIAILLALAAPDELNVLGITAVAGNVPLALTEKNCRIMCELAGRTEVPVFAGCSEPTVRPLITAESVHGKTGIDGANAPDPVMPLQDQHAVDWIIETLAAADHASVTVCTLGPLTNLGSAFARSPEVIPKVREFVLMGGGFFEGGNTTPAAEFNIYVDPHAAATVFESGVPLVMMPLDVTHQAIATPQRVARFEEMGTPVGAATAGMLKFFERHDVEKYGMEGAPLHDPTVIAYLLKPELFEGKHVNVRIEAESELTMGMTVVDWWGVSGLEPNCTVMRNVDDEGFYDLLVERLGRL